MCFFAVDYFFKVAAGRCPVKTMVFKISQNSQENGCVGWGLFFNKVVRIFYTPWKCLPSFQDSSKLNYKPHSCNIIIIAFNPTNF